MNTENISTSVNTNTINSDDPNIIEVPKRDPEKERIKSIIEEITDIITKYKTEQNKSEEETSEEILNYLKEKNIDIFKILDKSKCTLAQKYCTEKRYYYLKSFLLALEKIFTDNNEIFNQYLLIEDVTRMNIFEASSEQGDIEIFKILSKYLSSNNSLLNGLLKEGKNNVFHIAAQNDKIVSLLYFYEFFNRCEVLNIPNGSSWTPLHLACYRGYYDFVKFLVNLGADFNKLDFENKNPLFYAVEGSNGKIAKFLILNGINKYQKDSRNRMANKYCKDKNVKEILKDYNFFEENFLCKTTYQSLKGHHRHIWLLILLIIVMIIQVIIYISFGASNYLTKCLKDDNFMIEDFFVLVDISSEVLAIILYILFNTILKTQNLLISDNENKRPLYALYSLNENLCVKCKKIKSVNTQHCIACDQCIEEWDHHCFWLGICINRKNKKFFNLFIFILLLAIVNNLLTSILFIFDIGKFPTFYYGFLGNIEQCPINDFNWISLIFLGISIIYFISSIIFLVGSLIPFLIDLLSSKPVMEQTTSSIDINSGKTYLLNADENTEVLN